MIAERLESGAVIRHPMMGWHVEVTGVRVMKEHVKVKFRAKGMGGSIMCKHTQEMEVVT